MRGKGKVGPFPALHSGITPAYAGKSFALRHPFLAERDHPRVCGEKRDTAVGDLIRKGSPPRMRGKD